MLCGGRNCWVVHGELICCKITEWFDVKNPYLIEMRYFLRLTLRFKRGFLSSYNGLLVIWHKEHLRGRNAANANFSYLVCYGDLVCDEEVLHQLVLPDL